MRRSHTGSLASQQKTVFTAALLVLSFGMLAGLPVAHAQAVLIGAVGGDDPPAPLPPGTPSTNLNDFLDTSRPGGPDPLSAIRTTTEVDPFSVAAAAGLSGGSTINIIQQGENSAALAYVISSPQTFVGQRQFGDNNLSAVGVFGGGGNVVDVRQNGGDTSGIFLVNSIGVLVEHDQRSAPQGRGGVVIVNGPPGMKIALD